MSEEVARSFDPASIVLNSEGRASYEDAYAATLSNYFVLNEVVGTNNTCLNKSVCKSNNVGSCTNSGSCTGTNSGTCS